MFQNPTGYPTRARKAEMIAALEEAELRCLTSQEYTIGSRRLRNADLEQIQACLEKWRTTPTVEDAQSGRVGPQFTMLIPGRGGRGDY